MNETKIYERHGREPFHYRYKNFFVGLFILIPLLIIPLFFVYTLVKSDVLEKWLILYASYESGEGLAKGSAVNIRGIKVGHVLKVNLNDQGEVDVCFRIKRRYAPFVKKNSVARLKQKNFVVGDWEINLVGGGEYSPAAEDGDTLNSETPLNLENTVQQVSNLVASFEAILQGVMDGEGIIGQLLQEDTLADVARGFAQRIDKLFKQVDRLIVEADGMVANLNMFGVHGTATVDTLMTFAHHADRMVASLEDVGRDVDALVEQMDRMPAGMDKIIEGLQKDLSEAEILLKGLQNHWLFRRSVRKAREEQ